MNHDPETGGGRVNWLRVGLRYGLAVAAVAAAALLRRWLEASFGDLRAAFITFYPTVLLVALLAGGGPGALATLLSMALVDWWFITPGSLFLFEEPAQGISLGIFTFTCLAVSAMAEWLRRTRWVKAFAAAKAQEADELSRQAEELSRQSEELAQQNEELQSQSEELQSLNAELGRREHLVTKLLEAARLAGAEQEALDDVCAAGLELLGPAVAALVVCEKREDQLRICAYAGPLALPENWPAEGTFAGLTLREGRTACLNDAALRPDLKLLGPVGGEAFRAALSTPLHVLGEHEGALTAYSQGPHEWTAEQFRLIEWLAAQCGHILDTLRFQERLHQSESFYRQALESIPGMVFTTRPDGYCDYQSQQWVDYTGVPMSEHVGAGWNELLHPDDRPRAYEAWQAAVEGRAPYDLEYRVRRHDGQYEWFKVRGRPIRDAEGRIVKWFGVAANIDALKQAQEALRESESRVRRKLDAVLAPEGEMGELELADVVDVPAIQSLMDGFHELTHIPMALIDRKGKVLVGVGWQEICTQFHRKHPDTCRYCLESDLELTADIAPGQFKLYKCKNSMWDMATPVMVGGKHMGYVFVGQFFLEGEPLDYEAFRAQAKTYGFDEGKYIAALEKVPRLSRQAVDTAMGYFVKLADGLSQQSYSNVKLARTMAQREATVEELRRSNQDLEQFAYVSSHDLQEPLRMVTSFGGIIHDRYGQLLDAKGREYLGYVIEAGQRMQELVRGLLDYSRIGRHGKATVPVPLGECVEEALANLRAGIEEAGAKVVVAPLPALPVDRTQLAQVFQNLVGNALKFRSDRPPEVHIGADRVDGRWILSVADNGIGIDSRFAERIFMIFQRLHARDKYAGTGIGLAICKKIVERHGGRIWVESAPGKGSTFRFTIAGS